MNVDSPAAIVVAAREARATNTVEERISIYVMWGGL